MRPKFIPVLATEGIGAFLGAPGQITILVWDTEEVGAVLVGPDRITILALKMG